MSNSKIRNGNHDDPVDDFHATKLSIKLNKKCREIRKLMPKGIAKHNQAAMPIFF